MKEGEEGVDGVDDLKIEIYQVDDDGLAGNIRGLPDIARPWLLVGGPAKYLKRGKQGIWRVGVRARA